MIDWILHRSPKDSHEMEVRVAEKLKGLEASPYRWTVIWGYYYRDQWQQLREGDFIVIGPAGGILVMEVKSSIPRHYSTTGKWEGEQKDPVQQLMVEWKGVIAEIKKYGQAPFVEKVLAVPVDDLIETERQGYHQGVKWELLIIGKDFDDWLATWLRIFQERVKDPVTPDLRSNVLKAFGQGCLPEEKRAFIHFTEERFRQQFKARFQLLEQLHENQQLLVMGGTGTGKTWYALEYAFRKALEGKAVLFVTYHKALKVWLKRMVELRQLPKPGKIDVYGWEELWLFLFGKGGVNVDVPNDPCLWQKFFEEEFPNKMLDLYLNTDRTKDWPQYDVLVVDEAQDHDTTWTGEDDGGGWWKVYQKLLKGGRNGQAAIFYDPVQRPSFRKKGRFSVEALVNMWSQPARVHLQSALRYTHPIWEYFVKHGRESIRGMIDSLGSGVSLPEGPEVVEASVNAGESARDQIEKIIYAWENQGLCILEEVMILHAGSTLDKSPLKGETVLCGINLREYSEEEQGERCIYHTSIYKSKGLDSKAVVVIGLPEFAEFEAHHDYEWFMAVSRARQLLAVVHTVGD